MPTTTARTLDRLEDAEFLANTGENLTGAVTRLGFRDRTGLYRLCDRAGRTDIYATLAGRDQS